MATTKGYTPGAYPVVNQDGSLRKYITAQLQTISQTVNATNAQVSTQPVKFSALPAASSQYTGNIRVVTDSTTATWGATITGGGTHTVLCWCNGTNWTVIGA